MTAAITLEYHVPLVGRIRTTLYNEARDLYEFLDSKGEIARLKELDHLGVVRRAYEGAHHPRWEYVMLIMHVVDLVKQHVPEAHLSTSQEIPGYSVSSGQELLKMWAVLLHLGHVPWTFTAERALLAEVKRSRQLSRHLLDTLPEDEEVRSYARRLIQGEDVYRFYHVIAFVRLHGLADSVSNRDLWNAALKAYCLRARSVARLAEIYDRVRQVAFIALDSHYTPAIAGLDLPEIVTEPRRLALVLDPPDSSSVALLNAMQTHLYESVYLSSEVTGHTVSLIPALRREIVIKKKGGEPLRDIVEDLASGRMQQRVSGQRVRAYHVATVPLRVEEPFRSVVLPEARPLREEDDWCAELADEVRPLVTVSVWPFPDGRQEAVDVFAWERSGRAFEAGLIAVMSGLAKRYREDKEQHGSWLGRDLVQEILYGKVAAALLERVLRGIFEKVVRWEFGTTDEEPRHVAVLVGTAREACSFLSAEIRRLEGRRGGDATARIGELKATHAALKERRGRCFALPLARLRAFDSDGRTVGEIDGLWVELAQERVRVVVVEAKTGRRRTGMSVIQGQLEDLMKRLGLWPDCKKEFTYRHGKGEHPSFGLLSVEFVRGSGEKGGLLRFRGSGRVVLPRSSPISWTP